jgi:hypothetical protein
VTTPDERGPAITFAPWVARTLGVLGLLALLFTWRQELSTPRPSAHDSDYLYLGGLAWRHGVVPYGPGRSLSNPGGPDGSLLVWNFYPPHCGPIMAPFALLPYASFAWFWPKFQLGVLLLSVWIFCRSCFPDWPTALRLFVTGVTGLSPGAQRLLAIDQPSVLVIALLMLFGAAVVRQRWSIALLLTVLIAMKPTFLLPCLVLFLFCRRPDLLVASLAVIAAFTALGSVRVGPVATIQGYWHQIDGFERAGGYYDPRVLLSLDVKTHPESPLSHHPEWQDTHRPWNYQFLQIDYAVSAWAPGYAQTHWLGLGCKACLFAIVFYLWMRTRAASLQGDRTFLLLLFGVSLGLTLLTSYHQVYDALALAPIVLVALDSVLRGAGDLPTRATLAVGIGFAYLLPYRLVRLWEDRVILPTGLLVLAPICSYLTLLITLTSLTLLLRYIKKSVPIAQQT